MIDFGGRFCLCYLLF